MTSAILSRRCRLIDNDLALNQEQSRRGQTQDQKRSLTQLIGRDLTEAEVLLLSSFPLATGLQMPNSPFVAAWMTGGFRRILHWYCAFLMRKSCELYTEGFTDEVKAAEAQARI